MTAFLKRLSWMCVLAGGLLCLAALPAARASSIWCSLRDAGAQQDFVSDIQQLQQPGAQTLRKLASRFRRTVNARYRTFFTNDGGVCRSFTTQSRAELALAALRADLQRNDVTITVVGVF